MKNLSKENISKNQVKTVEQFKVLAYLKKEFDINEVELYLYNRNTIKLIDKNKGLGYFQYDKKAKKVKFYEEMPKRNELQK